MSRIHEDRVSIAKVTYVLPGKMYCRSQLIRCLEVILRSCSNPVTILEILKSTINYYSMMSIYDRTIYTCKITYKNLQSKLFTFLQPARPFVLIQ